MHRGTKKLVLFALVLLAAVTLLVYSGLLKRAYLNTKLKARVLSTLPEIQQWEQATSRQSYSLINASTSGTQLSGVQEAVKHCLEAAHLDSALDADFSLTRAMDNAQYLFDEYRKVIPGKSLDGYSSHCWRASYFTQWKKSQYSGHVGNVSFGKVSGKKQIHTLTLLSRRFPSGEFKSKLVCLPNLFVAGFPKCGSTYLYCFIRKLISFSTKSRTLMNTLKEPHFWAQANAARIKQVPTVNDFGSYLLNFVPGIEEIGKSGGLTGVLMDSTPNTMFNWPRFRKSEHDLTNYCILPTVIPRLLPDSKFVVIMRNPVKLLYSAFWFSCTTLGTHFNRTTLLRGPELFHERVLSKVHLFNKCMRDISVPSISHTCELDSSYSLCIKERLHLLYKCTHNITFNIFSSELPQCGRSRVALGMYYVHIRKWLSVVPMDRFLFLTLEELSQHPTETGIKILSFLGMGANIHSSSVKQIVDSCYENAQSTVDYKHDSQLQMRNETKLMLEHFYETFNALLADLVGDSKFLTDWGVPGQAPH